MTRIEKNMAEGPVNIEAVSVAPQTVSGEAKSPIPGMPLDLYNTLSKRHSFETIQKQQSRFATHEEFLADAGKEAERIRTVLKNAQLPDEKRLQEAEKLLSYPLSAEQKDALKKMHEVGKERPEAGIFNYTTKEIGQKIKEGREAFTKEEWKALIKSGLAGVLPPAEIAIDPTVYPEDSPLRAVAEELQDIGAAGEADEVYLKGIIDRVQGFVDAGRVRYAQARDFLRTANGLRITAEHTVSARPALSEDPLRAHAEAMKALLQPESKEAQAEVSRVLYFVREDIRRIYTEAMQATPQATDTDSWYGTQSTPKTLDDRLKVVNEALGIDPKTGKFNYQEIFWEYGEVTLKRIFGDTADIVYLKEKYKNAASYMAARVAIAIRKEIRGLPLQPNSADATKQEFGDYYLDDVKKEIEATKGDREKERRERRKRATAEERLHYSPWRDKFDFTWAETPEELDDSIEDWLELFHQQLIKEAEDAVYQKVQKWSADAQSSFEQARNRIRLGADDPRAVALREKIVGHEKTISGAKLVESRGGLEYFLKLRKDHAANYDAYFDGIYLREGSAIIADKISENAGAIYKSGDADTHKPLDGDTKTYRGKLEREIIKYGATHELYMTKDDFVRAELGEREIVIEVARLNLSFEDGQRLISQKMEERRKVRETVSKTDFETAEMDRRDIEQEVAKLNLTPVDTQRMIAYRLAERREARARVGRYSWEDGIEELLLVDSRGLAKAQTLTDPQKRADAIERVKARTGVFREIKEMLDKEDGLYGLTPDQRKEVIRQRIRAKITEEGHVVLLQEIDALPDQVAQDRTLWKWVEEYNKPKLAAHNEDSNNEPWFPSLWDEERLSINRPEDLVHRTLKKEQFRVMVEKIDDPYEGLTNKQIEEQIINDFRSHTQIEVEAERLSPQEAVGKFNRLIQERYGAIKEGIENILFERQQREIKARRNFFINVAQDKFTEFAARWGGLTTREVDDETGDIEFTTVYAEVEKILKAKIDKEAKQVEDEVTEWRLGFVATHPVLTPAEIDQKEQEYKTGIQAENPGLTPSEVDDEVKIWKNGADSYWENVWKLGYAATHPGLAAQELVAAIDKKRIRFTGDYKKETPQQIQQRVDQWRLGYIATHSGLSPQQFNEIFKAAKEEMINEQRRSFRRDCTFAATLGLRELGIAHDLPIFNYFYYGDESLIGAFAPLVGYKDDDKGILPELLDRGRREMEAVFYFMGQKHMEGMILEVVDRDPGLVVKDKEGKWKKAHEERWVRRRVINPGGILKLRQIFENMFMISTSGGVEVVPLAARIGNLGIWDEAWENGAKDKREWVGFRRRRNKWEFRQQSFYNTREMADPITHVDRLAGAAEARKYLVRGEVQGQGHVTGVLIEPMSGAYKYRDQFFDENTWALADEKINSLKQQTKGKDAYWNKLMDVLNDTKEIENIDPVIRDKLVEIGVGIMKPLIDYMNARRYVMNRAGLAPKNWKYDNELIVNAYFNELLKRPESGSDTLGGENLGYAIQGRSPIAIAIFRDILKTSTYHILVEKDSTGLEGSTGLYGRAKEVKEAMDNKRTELMKTILSPANQATIDTKMQVLIDQDANLKQIREELAKLQADNKTKDIPAKKQKLKEEREKRKTLEAEMIELTNQAVEAELNNKFNAGDLSNEQLRKRLINRRRRLVALHTSKANITKEIYRLINDEIDMRLHMEFVGEWPARLVAA